MTSPIQQVDSGLTPVSSGGTFTVTGVGAGNTLVVMVTDGSGVNNPTYTITDPGNTGTQREFSDVSGISIAAATVAGATGGSHVFTVVTSDASDYGIQVSEWTSTLQFQAGNANGNGSGSTAASVGVSCVAGDVMVAAITNGNTITVGPTSPFTSYNAGFWAFTDGADVANGTATGTSTLTATWTTSGGGQAWDCVAVTLRASAGPTHGNFFF